MSAAVREVAARSAQQPPLHELGDGLGGVDAPDLVDAAPGCLAGKDHDGEDFDVAVGEPGHAFCVDSTIGEERQGPVGEQRQGLGVLDHPHPQGGQAIGELGDGGPDPGDRGLEDEARLAKGEGAADREQRPQPGHQAVLGGWPRQRNELRAGVQSQGLMELGQGRVAGLGAPGLDPRELGGRDPDDGAEFGESEANRLPAALEGAAQDPGIGAGSGAGVISRRGGGHRPGFNCASDVNPMG